MFTGFYCSLLMNRHKKALTRRAIDLHDLMEEEIVISN